MASERFSATYSVETPLDVKRAAAVLAGEQSTGGFVPVPGETDELRGRYGAAVERITELQTVSLPSLPGSRDGQRVYRRAEIDVSWPLENIGYNLPALLSTIQGNLYELREFSGIKLKDIGLPASFAAHYAGPRFGIDGTRRLIGVRGRPLVGTVVRPSVGLSGAETAKLVAQLADADIDFIRDDELMANPPHNPFDARVDAVLGALRAHADRKGKRVMYAFNITDELDAMQRHYEKVVAAGGTAVMVSLNAAGLAAVKRICDHGALAVYGHRSGWGMFNRHALLGVEFTAYQKIWRLAGVDQIDVNGIANNFWESDDSVTQSIQACLTPLLGGYPILPVIGSGQTGLQAPETWRRTHTIDLLYMAGAGILAHPGGPRGGVAAIKQAWQAAVGEHDLREYAATHAELAQSLAKFGQRPV
jgi:ribulose-bisphosphate carboxylase large chain